MKDAQYNGWTNYETWATALWKDNDPGSYEFWKEKAEEIFKESKADTYNTRKENAVRFLADEMKDYFSDSEQCSVLAECTLYADLLQASLSEVNWYEIAENMLDEFKEETSDKKQESEEAALRS